MRIVVDTNQAYKLPGGPNATKARLSVEGITLAPYVLGEILLRTKPQPTLTALRNFADIRLGLEVGHVMEKVAGLTETEIVSFEPFSLPSSPEYNLFMQVLTNPSPQIVGRAKQIKNNNRAFCGKMYNLSERFRTKVQNLRLKAPKYCDMNQALVNHGAEAQSFLGSLVVSSISNGSQRSVTVKDPELLYQAVMRNHHLARFFKTILYYTLSFARVWRPQIHNFDPNTNRDDWTDITLPLYASDGDIILTADAKLRNAIRMVNPCGVVVAKSVKEL